jgi:hypothetical protein
VGFVPLALFNKTAAVKRVRPVFIKEVGGFEEREDE